MSVNAPSTEARIASALATIFQDSIVGQINRSVVLTQLLQVRPGSGKNLSWDVEFANSSEMSDSTLADGADVTNYQDDDIVPAVLQWGTYSEAFAITGKARAVAAAARNPSELEDLFGQKIERAVRRLAKNINADLYTGTGATNYIHGLRGAPVAALGATGSYATVDRASYATWKSTVLANSSTPRALTFDLMREMRRKVYEACGEMPDLIICDPFQHEAYGKLFKEQRRYLQEITLRGQRIVLDGGYRALEFDGIPVIQDVNCPAGEMIFLNTAYVRIRQLPDRSDSVNEAKGIIGLHGTAEEQFGAGTTGLTARINPLARTGDAYKFQLVLWPQLQVERPNAQGVLDDLATT